MSISIDVLRSYVEKVAKLTFKDESLKQVVTGSIKASLPGYYEVQLINGNETSLVYAEAISNSTYEVDDYVYLLRGEENRGEDYNIKYFIAGLVADKKKILDFFETSLIADGNEEKKAEKVSKGDMIIFNNPELINAIRCNGSFEFSAIVTTNMPNKTNFGFKFTFVFDNGEEEIKDFPGITFVGQPWKLNAISQKKIVNIGKANLVKEIRITLDGAEDGEFEASDICIKSGTLTDVSKDFSIDLSFSSGKNYLIGENDNGIVQIKANVKYGEQKIETDALKYYWYRHDDTEWNCLNEAFAVRNVENNSIVSLEDFFVYKTKNNIFEITKDKLELLPQYKNEFKCIVVYNDLELESEPIYVYNFAKEGFDVVLEQTGENPLLYSDDEVTLKASLSGGTVDQDIEGTLTYSWWKRGEEDKLLNYGSAEDEFYKADTLTIVGKNAATSSQDRYAMTEETESIYCKAFVTSKNNISILIGTSKSIEVKSATMLPVTKFKYWIETKYNPIFKAVVKEGSSYLDYVNENGDEGVFIGKLDSLMGNNLPIDKNGNFYIYYSEQNFYRVEGELKAGDYNYPKALRYISVSGNKIQDLLTPLEIEKLNKFYELTEGGKTETIGYREGSYKEKTDEVPEKDKIYYKKVENSSYYIECTEADFDNGQFKDNIVYYEKIDSELYINANYINTGTLTVSDNENHPIFSADIKNEEVMIGGFSVKTNYLIDGKELNGSKVLMSPGIEADSSLGGISEEDNIKFVFWAGEAVNGGSDITRPFWVASDGTVKATKLIIEEIADGSGNSQNIDNTTLINNINLLRNRVDGLEANFEKNNKNVACRLLLGRENIGEENETNEVVLDKDQLLLNSSEKGKLGLLQDMTINEVTYPNVIYVSGIAPSAEAILHIIAEDTNGTKTVYQLNSNGTWSKNN